MLPQIPVSTFSLKTVFRFIFTLTLRYLYINSPVFRFFYIKMRRIPQKRNSVFFILFYPLFSLYINGLTVFRFILLKRNIVLVFLYLYIRKTPAFFSRGFINQGCLRDQTSSSSSTSSTSVSVSSTTSAGASSVCSAGAAGACAGAA